MIIKCKCCGYHTSDISDVRGRKGLCLGCYLNAKNIKEHEKRTRRL